MRYVRKKNTSFWKLIARVWWTCLSSLLTLVLLLAVLSAALSWSLPDVSALRDFSLQVPLRIYSADNRLIAQFGTQQRIPVLLEQVPQPLIHAVLATEDARFYEHSGVDVISILRAMKVIMTNGQRSQGASTITMQVARNFFLNREKTYSRKINEMILALKIDRKLSKKKILELYLNKIYFGKHAYGVAAAAHIYYGKMLNELTLPEMAMIAGLPQAPSRNNPVDNPKAAEERRNHVLKRMWEVGFITTEHYQEAIAAPLTATYHMSTVELSAPYVAEMVRAALLEKYGPDIYTHGLIVYSTIRANLQEFANHAVHDGLLEYEHRHGNRSLRSANIPGVEAALVALNPEDGAVFALVGGFSYEHSYFNRAIQAERQPGSSFKPFIYSAALERHYTLASIFNDAPIVIQDSGENEWWRPVNHTQKFYGPTALRTGLVQSRNLVSIRLLQAIGVDYAVNYVTRFGFAPHTVPHSLSMALGSGTATPLQMAAAYAVFANGGFRVMPYFIQRIEDQAHHVIYEATPQRATNESTPPIEPANNAVLAPRVINAQNAYLITDALRDVIQSGTAQSARILGRSDLAGKTGTTNNQSDAWFSGFNRYLSVTVWMGFDNLDSLHEYAATSALPIWIQFMRAALQGISDGRLPEPPGIVRVRIDPGTGLLAAPNQADARFELFREGLAPTQVATPKESTPETISGERDSDPENEPLF